MAASIRKNFSYNFRRLIIEGMGLTQRKVATDLRVSVPSVSAWSNERFFPEERVFDRIREKYGFTYEQLVRDAEYLGEDSP